MTTLRKMFAEVAVVFTDGAMDKLVYGAGEDGVPLRMMSELKKGDRFREFGRNGRVEVAGGDAYQMDNPPPGPEGKLWCVPMTKSSVGR